MADHTIAALLLLGGALACLVGGLLAIAGVDRAPSAAERLVVLLAAGRPGLTIRQHGRSRLAANWAPRFITVRLARADLNLGRWTLALGLAVAGLLLVLAGVFGGPWAAAGSLGIEVTGTLVALDRLAVWAMAGLFRALPTYLDNVRQLVAIGNSLQQSVEKAAEAAPDELRRHLRITLHQLRHGAALADSLEALAERLDVIELHMLAASVQTNLRFGGRMSEVLNNLARVFRDRQRVERELRAATAETRFSAIILTALPVVVAVYLLVTNAGYLQWFIDTESGRTLLGLCVGLQVAGILLMRRIIRVEY